MKIYGSKCSGEKYSLEKWTREHGARGLVKASTEMTFERTLGTPRKYFRERAKASQTCPSFNSVKDKHTRYV